MPYSVEIRLFGKSGWCRLGQIPLSNAIASAKVIAENASCNQSPLTVRRFEIPARTFTVTVAESPRVELEVRAQRVNGQVARSTESSEHARRFL